MLNRIILSISIIFAIFVLGSCDQNLFRNNGIPKGNAGNASQTDSTRERIVGSMEGEIELPDIPVLDQDGVPYPPQKIRIDGVDAELPLGTKGKFRLSASGRSSTDSFTTMVSSWKLNSAPVQLFVFGGVMVAAGIVLMFFGLWWLGMAISVGGGSLIACGIMIDQYPWVILIVIGVGIVCAAYYVYVEYKKKNLVGENHDTKFVLEEITDVLSKMPNDILESYVKKPLREHDQSALIREITRIARLRK